MNNYKGFTPEQEENLKDLYFKYLDEYTENVTGNACVGDEVVFARAVFSGSYPNSKFDYFEMVQGKIIKDSYGKDKQQHTFIIEDSDGNKTRVKGRNIYKHLTLAKPRDKEERNNVLQDKYDRGSIARKNRESRKNEIFENNNFNNDEEWM